MANKLTSDAFFNRFKASSLLLLSCPIKVALFDRKLSLNKFVLIMKQKGFIYDYYLLKVVLNGKANNHFNLHYFTHLYNVLNLPMPTPEYLYKSSLRWDEIKQFKKERRNTNRIKRGQEPI